MTAPRVATQCDQCGQVDDHPKHHTFTTTHHYDCLPFTEKQMLVESAPVAEQIIAAALGGTHGADLHAHIESLHTEATAGE